MSELVDYDDSLLKDWWDGFCTQFCSRMTKQQSPAQPLTEAWYYSASTSCRAYQSVQLEPTYPAGQNLALPPATPIFGENNQRNQRSLMGVRVNASDVSDQHSFCIPNIFHI